MAATLAWLTAASASADIAGSKHDFSGRSWMPDSQICVLCHAPHNSAAANEARLVWNHRETGAVYQIYQSGTLKSHPGQPDGSSRYCLSCHDGTVMLNAFGGASGSEWCGKIIGTDLRQIHPLSMVYDDALAAAAGHLKPPSTAPSGFGGTIAKDLLRNGKMQCSACHEPHNRYPNNGKFLRKKDRNGTAGLCGICHTQQPPGSINMGSW